jgi:predicted amidohydrolase
LCGDNANLIPARPAGGNQGLNGWEPVYPNPALAPMFAWETSPGGVPALTARGNGRRECLGYLRRRVVLKADSAYCLRVALRTRDLDDLNRHLLHGVFGPNYNDGIFGYRREGDLIVGEERFPGPCAALEAELRLYYRFSAAGQVWWESVSLEPCAPIAPRLVKVACAWGSGDLEHWGRWLDAAGAKGVDLALLPEMFVGTPADAQPLDGPNARFLADKARRWQMHVSASLYERRGDLVLNTAPLYDRAGALVGAYSKNMLYDPELDQGVTPGVGYPVFHTDLGRVGIMICYDSWFPETARLLAYQGAEIVLFPNAGYYVGLLPARAADNGVWIAVSSLGGPAGVWDPGGNRAGELEPEATRSAPNSIRHCEKDDTLGMLIAMLDLSRQPSPHWWGGPMLSAPGGRRVRQTWMQSLEGEIAREAQRWWHA